MTSLERTLAIVGTILAIMATTLLLLAFAYVNNSHKALADVVPFIQATTAASSTVSNTSTQILATSTSRTYASICNDSNGLLFLNFGNIAALDKGIRVQSGACFSLDVDRPFHQAVNGIASGTSPINVSFIEVKGGQGTFGTP